MGHSVCQQSCLKVCYDTRGKDIKSFPQIKHMTNLQEDNEWRDTLDIPGHELRVRVRVKGATTCEDLPVEMDPGPSAQEVSEGQKAPERGSWESIKCLSSVLPLLVLRIAQQLQRLPETGELGWYTSPSCRILSPVAAQGMLTLLCTLS